MILLRRTGQPPYVPMRACKERKTGLLGYKIKRGMEGGEEEGTLFPVFLQHIARRTFAASAAIPGSLHTVQHDSIIYK
jgi:hypothetical protein